MFVGAFEATLHSFYTVLNRTCSVLCDVRRVLLSHVITIAFMMRMIGRDIGNVTAFPPFRNTPRACRPAPHSTSVVTQSFDSGEQVARPFTDKGRCSDLEGSLPDVRIVQRREHDDSRVWVVVLDLTTDLEAVDMRQV